MSALSDRIARLVADAIAGEDVYCELQDVIREVDALCAPVEVTVSWSDFWMRQGDRETSHDFDAFEKAEAWRLAQQPSVAPEGEKA